MDDLGSIIKKAVLDKDVETLQQIADANKCTFDFKHENPSSLVYKQVNIHGERGSFVRMRTDEYKTYLDSCYRQNNLPVGVVIKLNYNKDCALVINSANKSEWFYIAQLELI